MHFKPKVEANLDYQGGNSSTQGFNFFFGILW